MFSGTSKSFVRMTIFAAAVAAVLAGAALAPMAASAKGAKKAENAAIKAAPKYKGKVTAVDAKAGTITIHSKEGGDMTLSVDSATRVKMGHADATLDDIKVGMRVTVHSSDKKTALSLTAHEPKSAAMTPVPAKTPATPATPAP